MSILLRIDTCPEILFQIREGDEVRQKKVFYVLILKTKNGGVGCPPLPFEAAYPFYIIYFHTYEIYICF